MKKIASMLMLTAIMLSLCESAYAAKVPAGSKNSSGFTARTEPSIMPYYTNEPVNPVIMPYYTNEPVDPVIMPHRKDPAAYTNSGSR
nr:hypothetical protein [uncultured Caproiciproducens sp.]